MIYYDVAIAGIFLVLGWRVIASDVRFGKIYNKDLLLGFALCSTLLVLSLLWTFLRGWYIEPSYVFLFVWNALVSIVISYVLWRNHVWAAGDGKLFILLSIFTPFWWYAEGYYGFFPGLALLINTILPLFCFLFCFLCIHMVRGFRLSLLKTHLSQIAVPVLLKSMVYYLFLFLLGRAAAVFLLRPVRTYFAHDLFSALEQTGLLNEQLLTIVAYFFFRWLFGKIKQHLLGKIALGVGLCLVLYYQIFFLQHGVLEEIKILVGGMFAVFLLLLIIKVLLVKYIDHARVEVVEVEDLLPGMVLTSHSLSTLRTRDEEVFDAFAMHPDGLHQEQVSLLHEWFAYHRAHPHESLEIYKTGSFAPFFFLALLLTYGLQGTVLSLFLRLFS